MESSTKVIMKMRRLASMLGPAALFAALALAADDGGKGPTGTIPPVLRSSDPPNSAIVTLPGPPPEPVAVQPATVAPDSPRARALDEARPLLRRTKREYPAGFEEDSPKFLQAKIGDWREFDVHDLLGKPLRQRSAFDDDGKENGQVYAFADPIGRYKEFELDFDGDTGALRTVFVYPVKMTWNECRLTYGADISAADAAKGRKFYSYLNRRMDVLVDPAGKVISLGLY
jgi:hypothetical protein